MRIAWVLVTCAAVLMSTDPVMAQALPNLTYDESTVTRIERLADENPAAARQRATDLKSKIEREIAPIRDQVSRAQSRAKQYRSREARAEKNAKQNRERAKRSRVRAEDTDYDKSYRDELRRDANDLENYAKSDDANAKRYRARATEIEQDAQKLLDQQARATDMIARLDALLARTAPREAPPAGDTTAQGGQPASQGKRRPQTPETAPNLPLTHLVGIWRPKGDQEHLMVIAHRFPGTDIVTDDAYLELHSQDRVWQGAKYAQLEPDDPIVEFTYKPKATEMNKDLPAWVRRAVAGKLEWRLEMHATGTLIDPGLRMKFFPGEVQWRDDEDDPSKRVAKVIGDGLPRVFQLEPETLIEVEQQSAPSLWLEPVGKKEKFPGAMRALLKRQPFHIRLRMPAALAKKTGDTVKVTIKGLTSNNTETITLSADRISGAPGNRAVEYTHKSSVVIADKLEVKDRDPQLGSLDWIEQLYARENEEGKRIDLKVVNREIVEVRYGKTYQRAVFYDNWIKRGLDQHAVNAISLRTAFASVLRRKGAPDDAREGATYGLRLLDNYDALLENDSLLDIHKYYLGELYVGGGADAAGITRIGAEYDERLWKSPIVRIPPGVLGEMQRNVRPGRPDPTYYVTVIQGFVEALMGREAKPAARRMRDAVPWKSRQERAFVAYALANASARMRQTFQKNLGETVYAMPKQLVENINIVMNGQDLKGKRVVGWERDVTAARVVASLLVRTGQFAATRAVRTLRSDMLRRLGTPSTAKSTIGLGRLSSTAQQHEGLRTVDSGDMPTTLSGAQLADIAQRFKANPKSSGGPRCVAPRVRPRSDGDGGIEIDTDALDLEADARKLYGPDVVLKGRQTQPPQAGGTCVAASVANSLDERTGKKLGEPGVMMEAANSANDVLKEATKRTKFADAYIRKQWTEIITKKPIEILRLFFNEGVPMRVVRHVLRKHGAEVAQVPPDLNHRTNVRHIKAALDRDYDVFAVLDLSRQVNDTNAFHLVRVKGFERNGDQIVGVEYFEPNVGGTVTLPLPQFESLIARRTSDGEDLPYGNLMIAKWDGREWDGIVRKKN